MMKVVNIYNFLYLFSMDKRKFLRIFLLISSIIYINSLYSYVETVSIGEKLESIVKKFGEPDEIKTWETTYQYIYSRYGIDFLLKKESNEVVEIRFNRGYNYTTDIGIKIGDNIKKVFEKFGYPLKEVYATKEQASRCEFGTDRVYYKVINPLKSYKYILHFQGVLFWCDENENIIQIVFFRNYGEPISINLPTTTLTKKEEQKEEKPEKLFTDGEKQSSSFAPFFLPFKSLDTQDDEKQSSSFASGGTLPYGGYVNNKVVRVKGYYRKDGTYVRPHYRTAPNRTVRDNWSYKGNINPHTGKKGYKK